MTWGIIVVEFFRSLFGRIQETINCFRDLLTFNLLVNPKQLPGFFFEKNHWCHIFSIFLALDNSILDKKELRFLSLISWPIDGVDSFPKKLKHLCYCSHFRCIKMTRYCITTYILSIISLLFASNLICNASKVYTSCSLSEDKTATWVRGSGPERLVERGTVAKMWCGWTNETSSNKNSFSQYLSLFWSVR